MADTFTNAGEADEFITAMSEAEALRIVDAVSQAIPSGDHRSRSDA
jgi:hypothetical protein